MSRRLVMTAAAVAVAGGTALAVPASANPVTVTNNGGCRHVFVNDKEVTPSNGLCYLGPPPPPPINISR